MRHATAALTPMSKRGHIFLGGDMMLAGGVGGGGSMCHFLWLRAPRLFGVAGRRAVPVQAAGGAQGGGKSGQPKNLFARDAARRALMPCALGDQRPGRRVHSFEDANLMLAASAAGLPARAAERVIFMGKITYLIAGQSCF